MRNKGLGLLGHRIELGLRGSIYDSKAFGQ